MAPAAWYFCRIVGGLHEAVLLHEALLPGLAVVPVVAHDAGLLGPLAGQDRGVVDVGDARQHALDGLGKAVLVGELEDIRRGLLREVERVAPVDDDNQGFVHMGSLSVRLLNRLHSTSVVAWLCNGLANVALVRRAYGAVAPSGSGVVAPVCGGLRVGGAGAENPKPGLTPYGRTVLCCTSILLHRSLRRVAAKSCVRLVASHVAERCCRGAELFCARAPCRCITRTAYRQHSAIHVERGIELCRSTNAKA